ncbi:Metallo-dependent phosphatase-like protein [Mycena rosella]|uniref:Metallo-dependent phosphatase-like protein n=1 Tax=Mycena rosella TaxID=1033263 RepID=A0AAD7DE35_MYCRO|nr:Metallo-dependent phosphatase-like protein [Mycena rosella]
MSELSLPRRVRIVSPTSIVHLEPTLPPVPPSVANAQKWTRFVLLSDTHNATFDPPAGDVLIHTGDLTQRGTLDELKTTMDWLCALPHPLKIIIAGNHDLAVHREWYDDNWQRKRHKTKESAEAITELLKGPRAVAANLVYLEDEQYTFRVHEGGKEWSVYGSPWSPLFGNWAFGYPRAEGKALTSRFPHTDILLTHGPPQHVLDITNADARVGCAALAARVRALRPRLHVFGHIHEARGAYLHLWDRNAGDDALGAQNSSQLEIDVDGDDGEDAGAPDATVVLPAGPQTVFVNAANSPAGPNSSRNGEKVAVGGPGVGPIVVDLLE